MLGGKRSLPVEVEYRPIGGEGRGQSLCQENVRILVTRNEIYPNKMKSSIETNLATIVSPLATGNGLDQTP
jgi:hypothetical protein